MLMLDLKFNLLEFDYPSLKVKCKERLAPLSFCEGGGGGATKNTRLFSTLPRKYENSIKIV